MKIAVVEDDAKSAAFIIRGLVENGYTAAHFSDGKEGLKHLKNEDFDLAVLDIMLPGMDGFSVLKALREAKNDLPVIILSARDNVDDKVKGLELGGDDYMAKPFSFTELLARINAILRRNTSSQEQTLLSYADLTMDLLARKVTRGRERIDLQPQEFMLLEYLLRNAGKVVSRTMIIEHVWEYNFDPKTNIVETRMCRLREKIDKPFDRKLIQTLRGFGYVLE
ncbi:MAG: response regulator transcription factor [Lentisphaeria bacterium]|nr:response regulator transcription factor [Lentisphaeria bacterium]